MSAVQIQGNASGTGTLTIAAPNTNSNQTLTLPDLTATLAVNGPAFSAYSTSSQTGITNATFTKVLFDSENFDTNNNFASSRFTPTVAGYYQINSILDIGSVAITAAIVRIYKNGSNAVYGGGVNGASLSEFYAAANGLVYCNGTTDYIEIYVYVTSTSNIVYGTSTFSGFLARSA